jgi:tetratricopeptide (TPR) repeat protein
VLCGRAVGRVRFGPLARARFLAAGGVHPNTRLDGLKRTPAEQQAPLLQRLAVCHGKLGEHAKAREIAEQILKVAPNDLTALHVAAAACENLRDRNAAIAHCRKILELNPDDAAARKALARLGAK